MWNNVSYYVKQRDVMWDNVTLCETMCDIMWNNVTLCETMCNIMWNNVWIMWNNVWHYLKQRVTLFETTCDIIWKRDIMWNDARVCCTRDIIYDICLIWYLWLDTISVVWYDICGLIRYLWFYTHTPRLMAPARSTDRIERNLWMFKSNSTVTGCHFDDVQLWTLSYYICTMLCLVFLSSAPLPFTLIRFYWD